jgi:hypothetical protein
MAGLGGKARRPDDHSVELRRPHWTLTAVVIRRDRPAAPGLLHESSYLRRGQSSRGDLRRKQGYSVAMVVEESRLLQVCLFTTLHKHTKQLDYVKLLPDIVTIADEVDAQLKRQVLATWLRTRLLLYPRYIDS